MICHEILGVRENASVSDINDAYEKKMAALRNNASLSPKQYEKKSKEFYEATEACLLWTDKSFSAKTVERVEEYSLEFFSNNRVSSCIGPCTFCDWVVCCGFNSATDGFLVDCCGLESNALAVICDILIYAGAGFSAWKSHNATKKAEEEKLAQERRAKMVENARQEISSMNNQLHVLEQKEEELDKKRTEAQGRLQQILRFWYFYKALGSTYPFGELASIEENRVKSIGAELDAIRHQQQSISKRIIELSALL